MGNLFERDLRSVVRVALVARHRSLRHVDEGGGPSSSDGVREAMQAFVTGGSGFVGRNLLRLLSREGHEVRALARSPASKRAVESLGARSVDGDLDGGAAVVEAMKGCDVVFHLAAFAEDWGERAAMWRANVEGTEKMLAAAREAGVPRFVHTSTEAVLIDGNPIVRADETRPYPKNPIGLYAITKGAAERRVVEANDASLSTVVVRPRFIWGRDDSTLLPRLLENHRAGRLAWIGGGTNLTSTTHVDNCCEGLLLAAMRGAPGAIYFVTDGEPIAFRDMIEQMFRAVGVEPPTKTLPRGAAHAVAVVGDAVARALGLGRPPLPHMTFHLLADEVTVVDAKARRELGYVGKTTREEGMRTLEKPA